MATFEQANEMHVSIRKKLYLNYSKEFSKEIVDKFFTEFQKKDLDITTEIKVTRVSSSLVIDLVIDLVMLQ